MSPLIAHINISRPGRVTDPA